MIRKNEIVLYLARHILPVGQYLVHACAKYRTISFFLIIQPLFPYFLHYYCLQILYTTNFLIENVFIYLFHCFLFIIGCFQVTLHLNIFTIVGKGRSRVHKGMQVSRLPLHTTTIRVYQASLFGGKRHHKRKVL